MLIWTEEWYYCTIQKTFDAVYTWIIRDIDKFCMLNVVNS